MLKNLIKEAVLEALAEFSNGGVALTADKVGSTTGNNVGTGANSGGTPGKDNKPKPDVGVGTWSRK